jgi:Fe-S cluster assembly protein SufD
MEIIINPLSEALPDIRYEIGAGKELTVIQVITDIPRISVTLDITGQGSMVRFVALVYSDRTEPVAVETYQHHRVGGSVSSVMVKSVLDNQAVFSYTGTIKVDTDAQKTDAYQRNDNLLVSEGARASSKPILEILANDLRCTHGSTTGSIREDELWYLANRGIAQRHARAMIAAGFLESALSGIDDVRLESVRDDVRGLISG